MPPPSSSHAEPLRSIRARGGPRETALAGAVGTGTLLLLAVTGQAEPGPAMLAAAAMTGASLLLAHRARRRQDEPPAAAADRPAGLPHAEALERLEDPVLIVQAREADDLSDRRIVYANAAARGTLRIQGEDALLVTVLRHPEVLEAVDASLFGGTAGVAEYETGGAQGRSWRAWSAPLPPIADDDARRAVLVLRDETDARRSQRMRADFLANASHELRTPLASLSGFIETLRGPARDDPAARDRFLAIMSGQAERMARLIADLLSLSRIEMNEHVPPSGEADLAGAARDVAEALAPQAQARRVRVELHGADGPAPVEGDHDQIVQVVQNLLDNALKYTPDGGVVTVEVQGGLAAEAAAMPRSASAARRSLLTPDRSDRRYARVRVSDGGPGIAREHLPRLTERFYRVEGQKSGERGGTGLGLAIVKHVVNRHRGGLTVESVAGEGAVFTAYFPEPSREPGSLRAEAAPMLRRA